MVLPFSVIVGVLTGALFGTQAKDWSVFWLWFTIALFAAPVPIALWNMISDSNTPSYDPPDNPHPWGSDE